MLGRFVSAALALTGSAMHAQATKPVATALTQVADVPLPGAAVRFDYASFDATSGRLYIAHMDADQLVVFDTVNRRVVANLDGFHRVHGVIVAPEIHRAFASATGDRKMIAVDTESLKIVGNAGPIAYPDGLAYAPRQHRVFVSDEHGGVDAVIDATRNALIAKITLGGGAGNTVYNSISGKILVAVHDINQLVAIDPISGRYPLAGIEDPHGIALDVQDRVAFIAGEKNHSLAVFNLNAMKMIATYPVGDDPDVLAFDPGLKRLYVAAESGTVKVFEYRNLKLTAIGSFNTPHAHTVAVDPKTHLVYIPLQNINGHPVLRIMRPVD